MLNIYFGPMSKAIYDTSAYFNNVYLDSWLDEKFTQDILRAIDKGIVLSNYAVETKALGIIPVTSLSAGAKTLLLIDHMPDKVFYTSTCGDNCAPWILKIARRHQEDITINLHHIMDFYSGSKGRTFEIRIMNTGEIVHNMAELVLTAAKLLEGETHQ